MESLTPTLELLLSEQLHSWDLAAKNYNALSNIRTKDIAFDDFSIRIQFNPARAISSLAKIDSKSIAQRPCFLCKKNRPTEQTAIDFLHKYDILVNPFPIFPKHFTVASQRHEAQILSTEKITDMLRLAQLTEGFVVFFNGAKSGASAPDHFHFQIGNAEFFPHCIATKMPNFIVKESFSSKKEIEIIDFVTDFIKLHTIDDSRINVFMEYKNDLWTVTIFPRRAHRPKEYETEELLISPGAVDMAGVVIAAREIDFEKITKENLTSVFHQVSGFLV